MANDEKLRCQSVQFEGTANNHPQTPERLNNWTNNTKDVISEQTTTQRNQFASWADFDDWLMRAGNKLVIALFFRFGKSVIIREEFAHLAKKFESRDCIFVEIIDTHNQKLFEELKLNSLNYLFYRNAKKLHQIQGPMKKNALKDKIEEYLSNEKNVKKPAVEEFKQMNRSSPNKPIFRFGGLVANNLLRTFSQTSNISGMSLVSETWNQRERSQRNSFNA